MEKWKAKRDFAEAEDLFQRKKYNEALELLNRLNREFPNNRRVMMPRALCLAEMGRYHEAATICETILSEEEYPRARRLLHKLEPYIRGAVAPVHEPPGVFGQLEVPEPESTGTLDFGDERPGYLPEVSTGRSWGKTLFITAAIILVAAAVGGAGVYYVVHGTLGETKVANTTPREPAPAPPPASAVEQHEEVEPWTPDYSQYNKYADPRAVAQVQAEEAENTPPPAPYPGGRRGGSRNEDLGSSADWGDDEAGDVTGTADTAESTSGDSEGTNISDEGLFGLGIGMIVILFLVASVLEFVVLFCTLLLLNKMPRPTLGENLLLIGGVAVASVLISRIPYIGWLASVFMLITVFQLTLVDCLVLILVNAVVMVAAAFVLVGLIGMSLGIFF